MRAGAQQHDDRRSGIAAGLQRMLPPTVIAVAAMLALRKLDDFDTWWHLASGRWIVANAAVPHTDTLSFTVPDHPWVNLQWAYDVLLYGLYRFGGANALVLAATVAFTLAVWLLMRNVRRSVGPVAGAVLVGWAVLVAEERFLIRPEMVSFVLLEIVIGITLLGKPNQRDSWWPVPLLLLVWVNSHALFVIGLFCVGCRLAAILLDDLGLLPEGLRPCRPASGETWRRAVVVSVAAVAATVINPYGVEGTLFPFELWSRINGSNGVFQVIGEFRRPFANYFPTFSIGAYQALFLFSVAIVGLAVGLAVVSPRTGKPRSRVDVGQVVFFAGLAFLSLMARRNIGLFAFGAVPIVAVAMATVGDRLPSSVRRMAVRLASPMAGLVMGACVALVVFVGTNRYYRASQVTHEFGLGVFESNFPIEAARFAREVELPGPLYNDLTSGGYLTWSPATQGGVFIDGRLEVYDTEFFSEYISALSNPARWRDEAERFGINTVVLFHRWGNRQQLVRVLRADPHWQLVYHDETAVLFVRRAGNERVIARAQGAFDDWHERTLERLTAPTSSWRWPVDRATALESYGTLMMILGQRTEGIRLYERLLALGLLPRREASIRFRIAYSLARIGQVHQARMHLRRAAALDPTNGRIKQLLKDIGG